MVFPVDAETKGFKNDEETTKLVDTLYKRFGKSQLYTYKSDDETKIFLLIDIPENALLSFAENEDYYVNANASNLEKRLKIGWPEHNVGPLKFEHHPSIAKYKPCEHVYLKYKCDKDFSDLYALPDGLTTPFTFCDRVQILLSILDGQKETGGLELRLQKLTINKTLLAYYPMHSIAARNSLMKKMTQLKFNSFWKLPLSDIKSYYGAQIALYFGFVSFFTYALVFPGIIGLGVELVVASTQNLSHPITVFFSIAICIWIVVVCEYWKRREKALALEHGMIDCEKNERERAEFQQDQIVFLAGKEVLYFSHRKKNQLVFKSFFICFVLCALVIGTTAAIYSFKIWMSSQSREYNEASSIVASILNVIQINFWGAIYGLIKIRLTDMENHRTNFDYMDSMIAKNFIFQFINSYSSFFYIAFIASNIAKSTYPGEDEKLTEANTGQCGAPTCMTPLAINLGIVLGTGIISNYLLQLVVPWILNHREVQARKKAEKELGSEFTQPEIDYDLDVYNQSSLISDYTSVMLTLGFMTMFISALPGAVFIVFLSVWLETKIDFWKLTLLSRRPIPENAEDIGTWQTVIELLSAAAIVSNAAIIVYTQDVTITAGLSDFTRFWIFIGFQWILFSVQYIIRQSIPDVSFPIQVQVERAQRINDKIIDRVPDEIELDASTPLDEEATIGNFTPNDLILPHPHQHAKRRRETAVMYTKVGELVPA